MAQCGGEQHVMKEGHHSTNPLQPTTVGQTATHGHEQPGKHDGGILHRSGSGSSSSSEDDGEGGRRKKKGVVEKIKEKFPGGDHGCADEHKAATTTASGGGVGHGYEGKEGHEKKGMVEKIKEKLPAGGHQ